MRATPIAGLLVLALAGLAAHAASPAEIQASLAAAARAERADASFSAERGRRFFEAMHGTDWSCTSCHTKNPATEGRHATTGKAIAPLAPAANANRFTDPAKVEKWFTRNCKDVLQRQCTPLEKGDVLAYLMSVGGR